MKILHTESSMHWGGQEFRTLLEHNYLNSHGHTSWLACHPDSKLFLEAKARGAKNIITLNLSRTWRLDIAVRIAFLCAIKKIDIINSHSGKDSALSILAYLMGKSLLRSRQITSPIKKNWSYKFSCSHILAAANAIKNILTDAGVNHQRITVIGEGVDLQEFHPNVNFEYLKKEFNIQPNEKVIINIGMLRADKGQMHFIEAAVSILKSRPDTKFFLIGGVTSTTSKQFEQELLKVIQKHHLEKQIIMTGYRNDIAEFICLSDLVVIASIGTEAQSRIVPQSFACGKTVVTTNTGGLTELVFNEINGLVVPPKNAEAMSNAILRLLDNQSLKHQLESAAYELALEKLSFEKMIDKTIALYSRLTKN